MMRCNVCDNGDRRPVRRPYVEERGHRVAVVTGVPVEECSACGEIWLDEAVALRLDALLTARGWIIVPGHAYPVSSGSA